MYNWIPTQTNQHTIYTLDSKATADDAVKQTIEASATKAISLLNDNIEESSLYLLFEWDSLKYTLKVVVTDSTKTLDAPIIVSSCFSELQTQTQGNGRDANLAEDLADKIQFWLHDYLTTCTAFFKYSLVAIFHKSTRNATVLL